MYGDMMYTLPGLCMQAISLFLFFGWIWVCRQAVHRRRKARVILPALLCALAASLIFAILMNEKDRVLSGATLRFHEFVLEAYKLPWPVYLALEAVSAVLLAFFLRNIIRFSGQNISSDAVKETVDLLPVGICFGNEKGEVLLSNIRMTDLCFSLTGRLLQDTRPFWEAVTGQGKEEDDRYLVRTKDGASLLLRCSGIRMDGQEYSQFTATDVTEQARITADLRERNAKLWEVQYRMKAYHARAADMFMDEELLNARAKVHDDLGHLLLMGRNYLAHPENSSEQELLEMTKQLNGSLLADAEAPATPPDRYAEALKRAGRLGVHLRITGNVPSDGRGRSLIGQALNECVANAVKHAGGDTVCLTLMEERGFMTAVLTNNGMPPSEPIREMGGLLSLRRMTESMGGTMEIGISPAFRLTLWFPLDN